MRVLVVEDDDSVRNAIRRALLLSGYEVILAENAEAGIMRSQADVPDAIVLDLGLPDIDGWEVARQLKAAPATANTPIIALTGADLPHERVSAMRAGCDRHMSKPCEPAALIDAIRRCLGD